MQRLWQEARSRPAADFSAGRQKPALTLTDAEERLILALREIIAEEKNA